MGRILVVEDDEDVRPLIHDILDAGGHEVEAVGTFSAAMKLLEAVVYDLVLTDGRLGDGSGLDIADRARSLSMRALIVSGFIQEFPPERMKQHPHLAKPVRALHLLGVVDRLLGQPAA